MQVGSRWRTIDPIHRSQMGYSLSWDLGAGGDLKSMGYSMLITFVFAALGDIVNGLVQVYAILKPGKGFLCY